MKEDCSKRVVMAGGLGPAKGEGERCVCEATVPGLFPFELRSELGPKVFHALIWGRRAQ